MLLDKDFVLGRWVDRLLTALGVGVDRDSPVYWRDVRPLQYEVLEGVAFDHLEMGKVVVLDAPLASELDDAVWTGRMRDACQSRRAAFFPVWVHVSPETAYRRLQVRGEVRDRWKLEHWNEFLARGPYKIPWYVKLVLDNEDGAAPNRQVDTLLDAVRREGAR